jgi:cytochrome b involved in lipid metabolism
MIDNAELQKHSTKQDIWIAINNKVYDVTKFLDQHPGGEEIILEVAGQDATEAFEDIGHSEDARSQLNAFFIGEYDGKNSKKIKERQVNGTAVNQSDDLKSSLFRLAFPIVLCLGFMYYKYSQ